MVGLIRKDGTWLCDPKSPRDNGLDVHILRQLCQQFGHTAHLGPRAEDEGKQEEEEVTRARHNGNDELCHLQHHGKAVEKRSANDRP